MVNLKSPMLLRKLGRWLPRVLLIACLKLSASKRIVSFIPEIERRLKQVIDDEGGVEGLR